MMFDFNFDWRSDLNTNIEIVDFQHKNLFLIGRKIEQILRTECIGITEDQLLKIVCELRDYVAYHFYQEESLMQQAGYSDLEEHRRQHQAAIKEVQAIDFLELREKPKDGLKKIKDMMQYWIFEHILIEDMKMANEIRDILNDQNRHKNEGEKVHISYTLEAVVDNIDSAVKAMETGANRIELCSNMIIGGTTPTLSLFTEVKKLCDIKIDVVIRPRCGDYHYSANEFKLMLAEIHRFKEAGADGIIIGALQANGMLDYPQMQRMILTAGRMSVTLNRSFDVCKDPYQTLKEAGELGIKRVITSGQKATCLEGIEVIRKLTQDAGNKIDIVINCGIDGSVIRQMYENTGITSYRVAGIIERESQMVHRNMEVHMGLAGFNEYILLDTDIRRIRDAAEILNQL